MKDPPPGHWEKTVWFHLYADDVGLEPLRSPSSTPRPAPRRTGRVSQLMIFYRVVFSLAALYNLAFGLWAGFFPEQFFQIFGLLPPRYPSLWACLGMVVGLYGFVYAYVAWRLEDGDVLIAIALLGKLLGPLGWLQTTAHGELPFRTFFLTLFNDLIWWFPFLLYLCRKVARRGRLITLIMVFFHVLACLGLLWARGGNEWTPDFSSRFQWLQGNTAKWVQVSWLWVISTLSLPAFMASWILTLRGWWNAPKWIWIALVICLVGTMLDVSGETIYIVWVTDPARTLDEFEWGVATYNNLSAGVANALYCVAGLLLSVVSLKLKFLHGLKSQIGFAVWLVGFALTVSGFLQHRLGLLVTGGLTMVLFIPWAAWVGWRFDGNGPAVAGKLVR